MTGIACCARTARGQTAAVAPRKVRNSRRRMDSQSEENSESYIAHFAQHFASLALLRSSSPRRLQGAEWPRLLEGAAGAQNEIVGADCADNLQADGEARARQAAGDGSGGLG